MRHRTLPEHPVVATSLPAGASAFLVTDVEDSTRLWEAVPESMQASMARHDAILRSRIEAHGGEVFKTAGDAFYARFQSPVHALKAALELQRALAGEAWPVETPIRVRVAVHAGIAQARGGDYFGPALNVVSRILSVARGGQVLTSDAMAAAFSGMRAAGAEIESHGFYRLKGIDEPVELFEQGVRGRDAFFPPRDAAQAYRVTRSGDLWQPVRTIRHNLPAERDAFVGRAAELHEILQRFDSGCRLVSILGPAGTGKTRLVCRYGHAWLGDWPGGVYFCDLSATRTLDGVLFAVASALEVPLGESDPVGQLGHALAARGRCLVILDNFEQIVDCALATVGRWLDQATDAAFAVTSRERLHIRGEEAYAVEPLPLGGDAIELFVARARARRPDFALTDDNHAAVAEVVRLVDGLPLAIELAAARINVLSPAQLVARMRDRFHLLAGARGSAERQATLKAAIDWSWNLLTAGEQQAFAQCSVFEGGFTMEAAEAVLDLGPSPEAPLLTDAIQSLVDKSLLRSWLPAQRQRYDIDEPYFGMYLSIQEYAAGKLRAQGPVAVDATEQRHGAHFARLGTVEALETLSCHGGVARRHALALELDNLIAACRRAAARGDAAVAVPNFRAAWEVLELRGPFTVGSSLAQQVLAIDPMDPALRAAAIWTQARILFRTGRLPESEKWLEQGLALAREAKDRRAEGVIRSALGVAIGSVGRIDEGLAHYEAALAIHREMGNPQYEAKALQNLSTLRAEQGRLAESLALGRHALAIYRETGHRVAEAQVLGNLAVILNDQGDGEDARRHFDAALAIEREIGNRWGEGNTLGNLAHLEMNAGRLDDARSHSERAVAIARDTGDRWALGAHLGHLAEIGAKQGSFDEAAALWNESLAIHRDVGNRRAEGATLVGIAELLASQGRNDEAEPLLNTADSLLREVGDKLLLAVLACVRGRNDVVRGRHEQAKCALAEAEALRDETGATLESPVGKEIARLRAALAASAA